MTRDEVLELAQAANIATYINIESHLVGNLLEKFAELVAAAEREACASLCFQMWDKWMDSRVGNESHDNANIPDAEDCAAAIRARGNNDMKKYLASEDAWRFIP